MTLWSLSIASLIKKSILNEDWIHDDSLHHNLPSTFIHSSCVGHFSFIVFFTSDLFQNPYQEY